MRFYLAFEMPYKVKFWIDGSLAGDFRGVIFNDVNLLFDPFLLLLDNFTNEGLFTMAKSSFKFTDS